MRSTTMKRRRADGLCAMCGLVKSKTFRCDDCNVKATNTVREIRYGYLAAGLCFQCGCEKRDKTKRNCEACRERASRRKRLRTKSPDSNSGSLGVSYADTATAPFE